MEISREIDQKRSVNRQQLAAPQAFFNFHSQNKSLLPDIRVQGLTTLLLPWTI